MSWEVTSPFLFFFLGFVVSNIWHWVQLRYIARQLREKPPVLGTVYGLGQTRRRAPGELVLADPHMEDWSVDNRWRLEEGDTGRHRIVCASCEEVRGVHNPNLPTDWVCALCLKDLDRLTDEEKEDARQLAKLQEVLRTGEKPEGIP